MPSGGQNKLTQEKVIEQFKEVHGDAFDYSKVIYVNTHTPVEVYCKKHDFIFFPTPRNHKAGAKCTICGIDSIKEKLKKGKEKFKEQVIERYGDVYDFSLVEYVNTKTPVKLIHKEFGLVEIRTDTLLDKPVNVHKTKRKTKPTKKKTLNKEPKKI